MVESMDINTSQVEAPTLEPSRDNVQGLETSQDSDILERNDGEGWQEDNQDHHSGLAQSSNEIYHHQGWFKQ